MCLYKIINIHHNVSSFLRYSSHTLLRPAQIIYTIYHEIINKYLHLKKDLLVAFPRTLLGKKDLIKLKDLKVTVNFSTAITAIKM